MESSLLGNAARQRGIVHRDIKPANLVLTREPNRLVMIDFGSAWMVEKSYRRISGDGISKFFAAPELQIDPSTADFRSDQFSTTAVAYWMLTGKVPYGGLGGTAGTPEKRSTQESLYKPPSRLCPVRQEIPKRIWRLVDGIVETGLALDPTSRFQSDSLWVDALVGRLANSGLLQSNTTALTFIEASAPLWIWQPGEFRPDYHGLAWQLEKRWQRAHPRRLTICWATDRAARLFGGVAEFSKRASQVEHDLGTASVLAQLYEEHPELAARWVGEMILRRDYAPRQRWLRKIPDAAILDDDRPVTLIEFGGQYSVEHLRRFHRHRGPRHSRTVAAGDADLAKGD